MIYPTIDKEKTGKHLEKLMRKNGLTPKDICDYLSLSCVQTVYRWFEGINIPSIDNLYALSQLFQISMDELVIGNRVIRERFFTPSGMRRLRLYEQKLSEIRAA